MSDLDAVTQLLAAKVRTLRPLGYRLKMVLEEGGVVLWDGTGPTAVVSNEDGEVDTTLRISSANAKAMLEGRLDPTLAYMTGKLKVDGKLGVAMKIASMLGD
jgi:putative sterol carrier protein